MPEIEKLTTQEMQVADFNAGARSVSNDVSHHEKFSKQYPNNYLEYYLYPDMVVEHTDKNTREQIW